MATATENTFGSLTTQNRKRRTRKGAEMANILERKDRRMRFNNSKDPIYYVFDCIENRPIKTLAKEFVKENPKYIMKITGDDQQGKAELDNFIDLESRYPVIAVTSRLMSTGVDAKTCKLIVLDRTIGSMTEFKQIIGRGTRINEDYGKYYFTIMDFRNATKKFADAEFDGYPTEVKLELGADVDEDWRANVGVRIAW